MAKQNMFGTFWKVIISIIIIVAILAAFSVISLGPGLLAILILLVAGGVMSSIGSSRGKPSGVRQFVFIVAAIVALMALILLLAPVAALFNQIVGFLLVVLFIGLIIEIAR